MAATRSMVQHRGGFAIPFRQRVGHPANVVKVTVNVQRALGPKDIADDEDFVSTRCRSKQSYANGEEDNFTCSHLDSRILATDEHGFSQISVLRISLFLICVSSV